MAISGAAGRAVTRDAVWCLTQSGKLDDGARYRVATTDYLATDKKSVYKEFFALAEAREVAADLRKLVGMALRRLTAIEWSSLGAKTDGWRPS